MSASERKLDLFPLQRITSSDVILARTSQDAACSAACQTVKILFAPREIDQWFGNGMEEENTPTKTFIRVAVPENICLLCGILVDNPALRRKLLSGKQKTKTCQSLELLLGDVFPRDNDSVTICQNCSKRNETLTKNIFQVRANFSGPKGSLGNNLQSSVGVRVKRLRKAERAEVPEQGAIGRRASTKRRTFLIVASEVDLALSTGEVTNADPEPKPLLKTRDPCTQTEPPSANTEENN